MKIILLFFVLIAFGCGTKIPPPDNAITDPALLRGAIDARQSTIESARFKEVVFDYFGNGERVKVKQLILVAQPTYLRVQTKMPGSEELMSVLVSDGTNFAMHRRDTNAYVSGPATRENVAKLLPVDLSAADVARVMLGGAPWDLFDDQGVAPTLNWDQRKGLYAYSVERKNGGQLTMWVRHTDYAVIEVEERDAKNNAIYRYTTDDWKRHLDWSLPSFRHFIWPSRDLDFSMDVNETQLNVELPEHLFTLDPPAGSTVQTL